jgi:hypothetical protein
MTTRANQKERAKRVEPTPSFMAAETARDETRAAWLEGIPPVRQARVDRISLVFRRRLLRSAAIDLISWAKNQLERGDKTTGFSKKVFKGSARIVSENVIPYTIQ